MIRVRYNDLILSPRRILEEFDGLEVYFPQTRQDTCLIKTFNENPNPFEKETKYRYFLSLIWAGSRKLHADCRTAVGLQSKIIEQIISQELFSQHPIEILDFREESERLIAEYRTNAKEKRFEIDLRDLSLRNSESPTGIGYNLY